MYEATAVKNPTRHVDAVSQDESHTPRELGEEQGGTEKHHREHQHGDIVPVGRRWKKGMGRRGRRGCMYACAIKSHDLDETNLFHVY